MHIDSTFDSNQASTQACHAHMTHMTLFSHVGTWQQFRQQLHKQLRNLAARRAEAMTRSRLPCRRRHRQLLGSGKSCWSGCEACAKVAV